MSLAQPFSDYELLDRVGAGAMGTVFKARQKKLNRIVALKVLRPSLARDTRYVERLRREARIVAALNHPNIVTGYDVGEENGYHFFVMEFVDGRSLRGLLEEEGTFTEDRVLGVAQQVAAALEHAYARGVIHRDIKPGNVLIDEHGLVKLTDMGLAKGPADAALTRDGATVGTPQYISPEQARNPQDVDIRSDLYSLGATLYHMATGQPPFRGDSMAEVITKVLHDAPVLPRLLNPDLSEGISLVLRKLMVKNLKVRYQDPAELLKDLARLRRDEPPAVDESSLSASALDTQRHVWWWVAGVAGVALLGLAALMLGMQLGSGTQQGPRIDLFQQRLQQEVAGLGSPGARWSRLQMAMTDAPAPAAVAVVEALMRQVAQEIQQEVDQLATEMGARDRAALRRALVDPGTWPGVEELQRGRITPILYERTGLIREQLPARVSLERLDAVLGDLAQLVQVRDDELLSRFTHHLRVTVPALEADFLAIGDYAGACRLWQGAFHQFFNGQVRPLPERLADGRRNDAQRLYQQASEAALLRVGAVEQKQVDSMLAEVRAGIDAILRGSEGRPARELQAAGARLAETVHRSYPAAARFRAEMNPWPEISVALREFDLTVQMRAATEARQQLELAIGMAWQAFAAGDAASALRALPVRPAGDPGVEVAALHRRALGSAAVVQDALTRVIRSSADPLPAWLRGDTLEYRVRAVGETTLRLQVQPPGGSWREAQLREFRFADLWRRAERIGGRVFAAVPPVELAVGRYVLGMLCDEQATATMIAEEDLVFLHEQVWPRIRQTADRGVEQGGRAVMLGQVRQALERARAEGEEHQLQQLELVVEQWMARHQAGAEPAELREVRAASGWLAGERHRLAVQHDVLQSVPATAVVAVHRLDGEICIEVELDAHHLERGAQERWQMQGERLVFAGGPQSLAGVEQRRLAIDCRLPSAVRRTRLMVDVELPRRGQGERIYLLELRGVLVAVVLTADDRVLATIVEGKASDRDAVDTAVLRAQRKLLAPRTSVGSPAVVAGAVHRLVMSIDSLPDGSRGRVRLTLDDSAADAADDQRVTLCEGFVELDRVGPSAAVVYPLHDLAVRGAWIESVGG
jgi:tRNA A-37 threonylcarbamoyl transferase component Bud32